MTTQGTKKGRQPPKRKPRMGRFGLMVRYTQTILAATADAFDSATSDPSIEWQAIYGPGPQMSAALDLWLSLHPDAKLKLCEGHLPVHALSEEEKRQLGKALSEAILRPGQ